MSYILDALKKSQQERAPSNTTPLVALPETPAAPAGLPTLVLVAGAVVMVLLLVAVWQTFRTADAGADINIALELNQAAGYQADAGSAVEPVVNSESATDTSVDSTDVVSEQNVPAASKSVAVVDPALIVRSRPAPVLPKTEFIPLSSSSVPDDLSIQQRIQSGQMSDFGRVHDPDAEVQLETRPVASAGVAMPEGSTLIEPSARPMPNVRNNGVASTEPSVAGAAAVETRTLPPLSALVKLPDLIISSHIYSPEPASRQLSMNGRNWHEGDWITREVQLQEITPEGIVVVVDGYPFHVNSQNGWQALAD
ncbi:general secretion pathway protein GspB [Parathalassolituus penaei]|uniref:General secretion pathway protein GspB n=1 Tax=Parathalassolituus penaei TaxID=2997323 RepID=A0A9X3EFT3_9GAMM|nr:general secretion pathway protein GspB [Parathalassolituus penaei]MCY0966435.1 general secretion pathway protein GspB [Parathalassolituus penaei]